MSQAGLPLYLETWKNPEFANLGKKHGKTLNSEILKKTWKSLKL